MSPPPGRAGDAVDRIRLAAEALGHARVDGDELAQAPRELVGRDGVVRTRARLEARRLALLLTAAEGAEPTVQLEHGAVVVPEVAEQPPKPPPPAPVPLG